MWEVRIYDKDGNLKNVMTKKLLDKRSTIILNSHPRDKWQLKKELRVLQGGGKTKLFD